MKCERIQEWILTDYLDDQLDKGQKKCIDDHLAICPGCREFSATAKKTVVDPFVQAEKMTSPENLWPKIKKAIISEQSPVRANPLADFLVALQNIFLIPKAALAFTTLFIFILVAGVATKMTLNYQKTSEQIEYLAYLTQPEDETTASQDEGLGTFIEQYFL